MNIKKDISSGMYILILILSILLGAIYIIFIHPSGFNSKSLIEKTNMLLTVAIALFAARAIKTGHNSRRVSRCFY